MAVAVKVCGLSTRESVEAAVASGAGYVGFNFFPPSPRYVTPDAAAALGAAVPDAVSRVAVVVDLDDDALAPIVATGVIDIVQLHGNETPQRVAEVRARFGKPVIKAIAVAAEQYLEATAAYQEAADMLLYDAKAQPGDTLPGGNARPFDWSLLAQRAPRGLWLLAGGLNVDNVADAVRQTGAPAVDVSSGVKSARGVKDPALIAAFLHAANDL